MHEIRYSCHADTAFSGHFKYTADCISQEKMKFNGKERWVRALPYHKIKLGRLVLKKPYPKTPGYKWCSICISCDFGHAVFRMVSISTEKKVKLGKLTSTMLYDSWIVVQSFPVVIDQVASNHPSVSDIQNETKWDQD